MGSSGAFGGSGSAAWGEAHNVYAQGATGAASPPEEVVQAIARAMRRANRSAPSAPGSYAAGRTGPSRASGSDGYTRNRTTGAAGSGRSGLSRLAARGAAAVAGAQAYRARDATTLADLGLDLAALDALPDDRARCAAISQQLLGAPAHPEDAALNAVSIQTMMEVLRSADETDSERLIEMFTGNLAYEQALVELTSQQRRDPLPAAEAAKLERQAKKYIENKIRSAPAEPARRLSPQVLIDKAADLAARVLDIFGRPR